MHAILYPPCLHARRSLALTTTTEGRLPAPPIHLTHYMQRQIQLHKSQTVNPHDARHDDTTLLLTTAARCNTESFLTVQVRKSTMPCILATQWVLKQTVSYCNAETLPHSSRWEMKTPAVAKTSRSHAVVLCCAKLTVCQHHDVLRTLSGTSPLIQPTKGPSRHSTGHVDVIHRLTDTLRITKGKHSLLRHTWRYEGCVCITHSLPTQRHSRPT